MNTRNLIILIIIVFVILCILFGIVYRNQFVNSNQNSENINIYDKASDSIKKEDIDTSEKVAKMYIPLNNKSEDKDFFKDVTQNTIDKIEDMLKGSEKERAKVRYAERPDYIIEFNDTSRENISFWITSKQILAVVGTAVTDIIYRENDVRQLLGILETNMRYNLSYTEIDINKIYSPPKIYINDMYEAVLGSYTWKSENGNLITIDVNTEPEVLLKDKDSASGFFPPIISINSNTADNDLKMLPANTKVSYSIYMDKEKIIEKDAERMINGFYHLYVHNIKSDYIYVLNITCTDFSATYYFKYTV